VENVAPGMASSKIFTKKQIQNHISENKTEHMFNASHNKVFAESATRSTSA
jgi:hypothetical protein